MIRHTSARCLLLILLWPATGSAQTGSIRGSVVDQTDLVLPGATVTLRGNGVPRTAYSDEQGTFELAGVTPGTYTLHVSLAGFSDATVEDVTVSGAPLALQLASFGDTVVVTASRNEVRLIDAPVSTSVISTATLATTSAQNYGDLLRATPGVNVIQLSARDVQVTSRSPGNTLTNSQLVLVDGRSRLLVHEAEGFAESGMSISVSYNPTPSTPLGLTARVAPSWGGQATSGAEALWGRETMAGMGQGGLASGNRLDGEVGYGLPVGSRFVGTPTLGVGTSADGRDYRLGYRLGALGGAATAVELGVDAQRRERPLQGGTDHGALARATLRW